MINYNNLKYKDLIKIIKLYILNILFTIII